MNDHDVKKRKVGKTSSDYSVPLGSQRDVFTRHLGQLTSLTPVSSAAKTLTMVCKVLCELAPP